MKVPNKCIAEMLTALGGFKSVWKRSLVIGGMKDLNLNY